MRKKPVLNVPGVKKQDVYLKEWSSSCGGYEDEKYTCRSCKHYWRVEGIDS